ncbi:MAG TPA: thymidine phosphorylase [Actinomycetota bacterium]|nr:thymidine phosphorylase [Actinomycetota bacterium]
MASLDFREVVACKRDGREVPSKDLHAFVLGYAEGEVPDYLAAAFLMAAFLNGLTPAETAELTRAMVDSGTTLPLAGVTRPKVDKHSTGGVSDGVTLVFTPLAASLGLAVAKLSGRGLGHTGGTLDKLESIPGFRVDLSPVELERQVEEVGCAVAGQSKDLVPADGALYALRDATATVASTPLIAASVMSKKLAIGTDLILLDVKAGSGAFMKTPQDAAELAGACVDLARSWGRPARAAVTDMSQPLGSAVGNALDVAECVRLLKGQEQGRLRELSVAFTAEALVALGAADREKAPSIAEGALDSGEAARAFARMVEAQGGDPRVVDDPWSVLPRAPVRRELDSAGGWLQEVDAEALGRAAAALGAGRMKKGDPIDPAVGVEFFPKIGDRVEPGAPIGVVHARDEEAAVACEERIRRAIILGEEPVQAPPLIYGWHGTTDLLAPASGHQEGRPT